VLHRFVAIQRMQRRGVNQFVYTNVDRDGMLDGPDLDANARAPSSATARSVQ